MDILFNATAPAVTAPSTAVASSALALPAGGGNSIRVTNEGPNILFLALGDSSVAATLPTTGAGTRTSTPIPVGISILRRDPKDTHFSVINRAAGTSVATIQIGEGGL